MAQKEEVFVGLDIGSHKITTVVGRVDEENVLDIIGVGISRTTGVRKGIVAEIEETVSGISESLEVAERMAGVQLDVATVNINGSHISSFNSKGVVAVGKANQEVTYDDISRVEEAARAVQLPTNKEILHVIPRIYSIDGQEGVRDPIGMTGIRLEGEMQIITVSQPAIRNLKKCISQSGVQIEDMIAGPLAASKAVAGKKERELGCVVIDIGATTTGIIVYEDDSPLYASVLPVGSAHITNDIAIGLRTSIDVAEKVKIKFGTSLAKAVPEKAKIDLSEIDMNEEGIVSKRHVAEIIEARLHEMFMMIRGELRKVGRDCQLPSGAILTGGGSKLEDIDIVGKDALKLPCVVGKPHNLKGMVEKIYDPQFSTAVGLMLYQFEESGDTGGSRTVSLTFGKLKKVFKTFMP